MPEITPFFSFTCDLNTYKDGKAIMLLHLIFYLLYHFFQKFTFQPITTA